MTRHSLSTYRAKRDFAATSEPRGAAPDKNPEELRFVIQKHAATRLHYDFRLELNGVFKSWAVTRGPSLDPADKRLAVEVEDHPLEYGDFEGTIPKGQYGGGTVQLWDRGFWHPEGSKTPAQAIAGGELKFSLEGRRLKGGWVLVRMRAKGNVGKRNNWLLIKHRDASAQPGAGDAVLNADRSIASGRTMKQINDGTGKSPTAFVLTGAVKARADAVWHGESGENGMLDAKSGARPSRAAPARKAAMPTVAKTVPGFIGPQLCKLVHRPPSAAGWGHEVKFDGYRMQLHVLRRKAVFRTRSGLDWTKRFAALARDAGRLPDCVIDGEVVGLDAKGLPSFMALQAALSNQRSEGLIFYAFDLLFDGRMDYRPLPLSDRKTRLARLLAPKILGKRIRYVEHVESQATTVLESACNLNLEGIVSKKLSAPYVSGRSGYWTKAKCHDGQEVVLGGWSFEGKTVRSLLAGVFRAGELIYVGRIGTGYSARVVKTLQPQLDTHTLDKSPFGGDHPPRQEPNVRWLKPTLVAEIEFAGWTGSGMIRQAVFKGLRQDKATKEIVVEKPVQVDKATGESGRKSVKNATRAARLATSGSKTSPVRRAAVAGSRRASTESAIVLGVTISNPDKALWPRAGDGHPLTKLDLAHYFSAVGHWMLPHLTGRPCSLVRAPDGIQGEHFFQRHAMPGMTKLFSLVTVRGDKAAYVQIDRIEALAAVAQLGALEIHPWNCAPGRPELAGRLVFDLDPAPDVPFEAVIDCATEVRDRLVALGLVPFCKTTGGKGLHVVVPLATKNKQALEWPAAKQFAHLVCAQMAEDSPRKYLDTMSKHKRAGRIFLDYLRNDRLSTAVAPLSPRARDGAAVSMPVVWKDVCRGLEPATYTVHTVPALLRKSRAWADYADSARPLAEAIRTITAPATRSRRRSAQK